jgi:hypothetical protein
MQTSKIKIMKTKTLQFGLVIAIIGTLTISSAQAQDEPAVKIVPGNELNTIKLIYGYESTKSVQVNFLTIDGLFEADKIDGRNFQTGFIKKYNVEALRGRIFWVQLDSPELSVIFKMTPSSNGKWATQLEQTIYNHTLLAKR